MKKLMWIIFLLPIMHLTAQSGLDEEEFVIQNMCNYLIENKEKSDSIRVNEASEKYLYPYLDKQIESEIEGIIDRIFFRYQKQCPEFMIILDKSNPVDENEGSLYDQPEKSTLTKNELDEFKKHKNYFYQFLNEITNVAISNGEWVESFDDGTFSRTKMEWIGENSFKLTFIESDNQMKNSYSRAGEEYFYDILSKEENYYFIQSLQSHGKYLKFKLYIK